MSIYAKVIADSISPTGSRLTTMEINCHRFIWPEVLTHRAFSRNSQSSRAYPTSKLIEQVRENPAYPVEFGTNQAGMQAGVPFNESQTRTARILWRKSAEDAADRAEALLAMKTHKQVVNRVLEPYLWHRAIITSTLPGWLNFLEQRLSPLAQPEICDLASRIDSALTFSQPLKVDYSNWHLPYITGSDFVELNSAEARAVSVARCARVSYLTHDGVRDVSKDLELYDKLVTADPPHWSPLEHVATPGRLIEDVRAPGNLDGWLQLRHLPEYQ